jgi:hypothetical protein
MPRSRTSPVSVTVNSTSSPAPTCSAARISGGRVSWPLVRGGGIPSRYTGWYVYHDDQGR